MTARDRLRAELIQVAAVAVAIVHDLDHGGTEERGGNSYWSNVVDRILSDVYKERERQATKWGNQHHTPELWMSILMEEVGEAAQEALRMRVEAVREIGGQDEADV